MTTARTLTIIAAILVVTVIPLSPVTAFIAGCLMGVAIWWLR